MRWVKTNPNPDKASVGDCSVRAIAIAEDLMWDDAYDRLDNEVHIVHDMPSSNRIIDIALRRLGYSYHCLFKYQTVRDFCRYHNYGTFVLGTGTHVVAVIDGRYYDTWDSGDERVIYYWRKEY